jgi:hypothetical protein
VVVVDELVQLLLLRFQVGGVLCDRRRRVGRVELLDSLGDQLASAGLYAGVEIGAELVEDGLQTVQQLRVGTAEDTAHLGNTDTTDFEPCDAHAAIYGESADTGICDDCPDCQGSVREVVEQMAQWKWTTTLRINEIAFDREGIECDVEIYSDNTFEVAIIEQDPRNIMIGPPGEGGHW